MKLYAVGIGAGDAGGITYAAREILENADVIVGYTVYAELVKKILPEKEYLTTGMRRERERCEAAVRLTLEGRRVAVVCSGDPGVYGMASLLHEIAAEYADIEVCAVSGVSAMLSGGALVGAPLSHDFAVVSLSDLLTPRETIEKRLEYAAAADFVICLYNPASRKRRDYLEKACGIILKFRDTKTICAAAKNIGRDGEEYTILTLGELKSYEADMFTTIFIGNSQTKIIKGKMVTPRGYKNV